MTRTTHGATFLDFMRDRVHGGDPTADSVGELLFVVRFDCVHRCDQRRTKHVTE